MRVYGVWSIVTRERDGEFILGGRFVVAVKV